jgi:alkanesulfonate monooxygenase SsuD/methylene tetrahydromethanopterin reductase-like flavin-dependent oxidoreductase (luciferase family)
VSVVHHARLGDARAGGVTRREDAPDPAAVHTERAQATGATSTEVRVCVCVSVCVNVYECVCVCVCVLCD